MLSGPPLPLSQDIPLQQLLPFARPPGTLGAWVRGSMGALHLYDAEGRGSSRMLVGPDLGHLLGRCNRIALRAGSCPVVLDAEAIICWRVLQVITATPHLPPLERLHEIFPGAHLTDAGFDVGIFSGAPEHVLAECLTYGIRVNESRVIYRMPRSACPVQPLSRGDR